MCLVYGYPWDLSPCFCNLNVSLSLTPRALLENVSCRASAHLPGHLFYVSFLLWPCWLLVCLPWFPHLHPHLPCHLQAGFAKGVSVPTFSIQGLPVALKGLSWQVRPSVSFVCSSPPAAPWLHSGPGELLAGSGVVPAAPASMPSISFFFLVNLENIFQNSSSELFLFIILQGKRNHFFIDAHMLLRIFVITPQQFISFTHLIVAVRFEQHSRAWSFPSMLFLEDGCMKIPQHQCTS